MEKIWKRCKGIIRGCNSKLSNEVLIEERIKWPDVRYMP